MCNRMSIDEWMGTVIPCIAYHVQALPPVSFLGIQALNHLSQWDKYWKWINYYFTALVLHDNTTSFILIYEIHNNVFL